mmetsp:Transcript_45771/g.53566  ORF Transcript_45771/g.53566 Transcript_45771/m.53566 type:complete len:225 (+) Transcript_45771:249-923(+)
MYESEKSAFSTFAPSKLVPVKTALTNTAPRNVDPLKLARSITPLLKSAPSKLLSCKYALLNWVSTNLAFDTSVPVMMTPERSNPEASFPAKLHCRKSYNLSRAALAWPILELANWHLDLSEKSIGGNLNSFVEPSAKAAPGSTIIAIVKKAAVAIFPKSRNKSFLWGITFSFESDDKVFCEILLDSKEKAEEVFSSKEKSARRATTTVWEIIVDVVEKNSSSRV